MQQLRQDERAALGHVGRHGGLDILGYTVLYRDCILAPAKILLSDPYPFGLPDMLNSFPGGSRLFFASLFGGNPVSQLAHYWAQYMDEWLFWISLSRRHGQSNTVGVPIFRIELEYQIPHIDLK